MGGSEKLDRCRQRGRPREDPPFTHFDEETRGEGGKR